MIRSSRQRSQSMAWPAGFGSGSTEDAAKVRTLAHVFGDPRLYGREH